MIDTQQPAAGLAADNAENAPRFHIDTSWFAEQNLSFEDMVRARVCDSCRAQFGSEREERVPVFDPESGRPRIETRKTIYGEDPLRVIRDHCGKAKNYITRDMPTLEALFRIFLSNGNQPMTLEQARDELQEWCPGGGCQWLLLPLETLERVVRGDTYYGLRELTLP